LVVFYRPAEFDSNLKNKKKIEIIFISLDKTCVDVTATTKDETRNLAYFKFAKKLFVAGKIPAARR
jgi:hypothetical protein